MISTLQELCGAVGRCDAVDCLCGGDGRLAEPVRRRQACRSCWPTWPVRPAPNGTGSSCRSCSTLGLIAGTVLLGLTAALGRRGAPQHPAGEQVPVLDSGDRPVRHGRASLGADQSASAAGEMAAGGAGGWPRPARRGHSCWAARSVCCRRRRARTAGARSQTLVEVAAGGSPLHGLISVRGFRRRAGSHDACRRRVDQSGDAGPAPDGCERGCAPSSRGSSCWPAMC